MLLSRPLRVSLPRRASLPAALRAAANCWALMAPSTRVSAVSKGGGARVPVVIDTDIGDDMDDTWAIALALRSPELDVKAITTTQGNPRLRAALLAELLMAAGRQDVAIGLGPEGDNESAAIAQEGWLGVADPLASYPGRVDEDGVGLMLCTIADSVSLSGCPVHLLSLGPMTNIAAALARDPSVAEKVALVGMGGSIFRGYGDASEPHSEYNVAADTGSAREVLGAPWARPPMLAPLDVCEPVVLQGDNYRRVLESSDPLAQAVVSSYRSWAKACTGDTEGRYKASRYNREATKLLGERSTVLFDCAAVGLLVASAAADARVYDPSRAADISPGNSEPTLQLQRYTLQVTDDGLTRVLGISDAAAGEAGWGGAEVDCAVAWASRADSTMGGPESFTEMASQRLTYDKDNAAQGAARKPLCSLVYISPDRPILADKAPTATF